MSLSVTAGNFALDGFSSSLFAASYTAVLGDDFVFNWAGPDVDGNGTGQQVVSTASTSDHWTLTVSLVDYLGFAKGGEVLYRGANAQTSALSGGTLGETVSQTFTGSGDTALVDLIRALNIDTPLDRPDSYQVSFHLVDDTASGSADWSVDFGGNAAPCFVMGTRVAVPGGERAVEDLRIGDLVMTASGVAKKVKWLGRRAYTAAQVAANAHVRSVLVLKDAIAQGMPHRDLAVSPMHALLVDGCFVPAASLVNGVTVLREDELAPVSYIHIEMDAHDVVFAEGQPAETFVDDASRQMFDNADEYYAIYGADQGTVTFSAPRVEEGMQLEALRRRIAARAGLTAPAGGTGKLRGHVERLEDGVMHGWVIDTSSAAPVELEILVDGELVATAIANRYRADLDHAGIADGRGGFSVALPASVTSLSQVAVRRTADGAKVAVPQVAMAD